MLDRSVALLLPVRLVPLVAVVKLNTAVSLIDQPLPVPDAAPLPLLAAVLTIVQPIICVPDPQKIPPALLRDPTMSVFLTIPLTVQTVRLPDCRMQLSTIMPVVAVSFSACLSPLLVESFFTCNPLNCV